VKPRPSVMGVSSLSWRHSELGCLSHVRMLPRTYLHHLRSKVDAARSSVVPQSAVLGDPPPRIRVSFFAYPRAPEKKALQLPRWDQLGQVREASILGVRLSASVKEYAWRRRHSTRVTILLWPVFMASGDSLDTLGARYL
jgi:hypothetical protein